MNFSCRACLIKNQKEYFSLLSVFPELGDQSILDLLNFVTSSKVIYSENLPQSICTTCCNALRHAYGFIVLFNKSQVLIQENAQKESKKLNNPQGLMAKSIADVQKEKNYNFDSNTDKIFIVNDDGSICEDVIDKIFINEESDDEDHLPKKTGETSKSSSIKKKHSKYIMVSVEDVRKEETPESKIVGSFNENDTNFYQNQTKESYSSIKDEVALNEEIEAKIKEGAEKEYNQEMVIRDEYDIDDIENYEYNENDDFCVEIEDEMQSNQGLDQRLQADIIEMEKNREKNMKNVHIVTIQDILEDERLRKSRTKKVLTVEDVLQNKLRSRYNEYSCEVCGKTFDRPNKLTLHRLKSHNGNSKHEENDIVIYSCEICKATFDRRRKVTLHKLRVHHPNWQEKFKCRICGLQLKTSSAHINHMTKHMGKIYSCDRENCEKKYRTPSKLREHILRIHEKKFENKYLCSECGKSFKYSNALRYHMNKHYNFRNFVCRYCGSAHLALHALKRHERTHTGERPYKCKHCHKAFAGVAERKKHEYGHEGILKFKCKYCDKRFIQTYNMKVHWLQHGGSYVCEICNRNFADPEILKFHYAHSHKIKDVIIEDSEEPTTEVNNEDKAD